MTLPGKIKKDEYCYIEPDCSGVTVALDKRYDRDSNEKFYKLPKWFQEELKFRLASAKQEGKSQAQVEMKKALGMSGSSLRPARGILYKKKILIKLRKNKDGEIVWALNKFHKDEVIDQSLADFW